MALASLSLPSVSYSFDSDGTAIVPVTAGKSNKTLGKIEIQSPLVQMSEFFAGIDKSLIDLVTFAKKSFNLEEKESKKDPFKGLEDEPTKEKGPSMLDTLKGQFESLSDAFNQVSIGEKLSAALMVGALALFLQFEETIVFVIDKLIGVFEFVRDNIFGGGPNAGKNTLLAFLGLVAAFKVFPLIKAVTSALLSVTGFLGINKRVATLYRLMRFKMNTVLIPNILSALKALPGLLWGTVGKVFRGINIGSKLLLVNAQGALGALSGGMTKAFSLLGKAFLAMRLFIVGTMVPAITGMIASMLPTIVAMGPFILIGLAIAAAIGAVMFGIKKAFDTFKEATEDGDSKYAIILKTITSFFGSIAGIIPNMMKGLLGFIVGLFGFDDLKEKLKNMDIGQMISDALFNLTNTFLNFIKALAMGTTAAVKALPRGGETPQEAFNRVYDEVIAGKTPNIKREQVKDANKESEDGDEKFVQTKFMTQTDKLEAVYQDKTITNTEMLRKTDMVNQLNIERKMLEDAKAATAAAVAMTNIKQGDNINIKKEEYISTQLDQNNTDLTAALLDVQGS